MTSLQYDMTQEAFTQTSYNRGPLIRKQTALISATKLGLDFGTSNTAIAALDIDGHSRLLALEDGKFTIPSAIFYGAELNTPLIGRQALKAYADGEPGRLLRSIKSILGSSLMHQTTFLQGRQRSYLDILSDFLGEVFKRAVSQCQTTPSEVTIGRPVEFSEHRDQDRDAENALRQVATSLGWKDIAFVLEPVAASFWLQKDLKQGQVALIADLGGGTSDFCLLQVQDQPSKVTVLSTSGVHIAGDDFDYALALEAVMPHLGFRHTGAQQMQVPGAMFADLSTWHKLPLLQTNRALEDAKSLRSFYQNKQLHDRLVKVIDQAQGHLILAEVENAKTALSKQDTSSIHLGFIEDQLETSIDGYFVEKTLCNDVEKIANSALNCLAKAGKLPGDVNLVLLTGGSSGLATIQKKLQTTFENARLVKGDQFTSIALGLALSD